MEIKLCCLPMNLIFITAFVLIFTCVDANRRKHKCKLNEEWMECGGCELKCGQSEFTPCTLQCRPAGCYCPPYNGFRRNFDGKCIPKSQCPKDPIKYVNVTKSSEKYLNATRST
uniref:Serine protease inhibitor 1 n=1 Tax=Dirofilaria repens TaxID=31241 RepID=A0A411N1B1_9BILA|nr:serine protease inhibitor 1 [Dirofilaria repens]